MGFHTFDPGRAERLEDVSRYAYLSAEELLALLDPAPDDRILDVGSGTGFYTNDVAPYVERVYALDLQPAMHALYREKGLPGNVEPMTAAASALPFRDGVLDSAFSTMTYHEFATPVAVGELARTLRPGGRHVVVDWTANGEGERGPPRDERYSLSEAIEHAEEAGFEIDRAEERRETFVLVALA